MPIGEIIDDYSSELETHLFSDNQPVTVSGVIESVKTKTTKSSSLMSYIRLDDGTGSMELIAFQRALDSGGSYVVDNAMVIVSGRISIRDEKEPQLVVDTIRPLSDLSALPKAPEAPSAESASDAGHTLWLKLPSEDPQTLEHIRLLLTMFPGQDRLIIYCAAEKKKLGIRCRIHPALLSELGELYGENNVIQK